MLRHMWEKGEPGEYFPHRDAPFPLAAVVAVDAL
jgi:uncharacterized protein (DUF952 family)